MSFRTFDKSGDGTITLSEMMQAFSENKSEVSSDDALRIFKAIDQDNNGTISFSEYMVAAMTKKNLNSEDKLQAAFRMFDKNGTGLICVEELREILEKGGSHDWEKIVKEVDTNGDGEISYDEFNVMMTKLK